MNKKRAIKLAGGNNALARLLGITPGGVSNWPAKVPEARVWQLKVLKPEWFVTKEKNDDKA